ncbi:MAG TPA: TMEM175 family protein [Telluria sp.]|nr:TMEM175 family protein [Telluria sp.]
MGKNRLEAFSDGVIAIIITIMVLELKVPHGADLAALAPLWPVFLSYVLSFVYVAIYWNNHHHMLHAAKQVSGKILWYNMHLLFWLSLFPFATAWMGENHFSAVPTALYGTVLMMAALAYHFLVAALIAHHGKTSDFALAFGKDTKGKLSIVAYLLGVGLSFVNAWLGFAVYAAVALSWFTPDRRVEKPVATRD